MAYTNRGRHLGQIAVPLDLFPYKSDRSNWDFYETKTKRRSHIFGSTGASVFSLPVFCVRSNRYGNKSSAVVSLILRRDMIG